VCIPGKKAKNANGGIEKKKWSVSRGPFFRGNGKIKPDIGVKRKGTKRENPVKRDAQKTKPK
jgi:hypothetical protein